VKRIGEVLEVTHTTSKFRDMGTSTIRARAQAELFQRIDVRANRKEHVVHIVPKPRCERSDHRKAIRFAQSILRKPTL
jgi:hypothetical protein